MHRNNGNTGTWQVDRVFRSVGRIHRASGTNDKKVAEAIDTMLTQLYQQGRFDVLEALRDGKLSFLEVYGNWRATGVERLPNAAMLRTAIPQWEKWAKTLGDEHQRVVSRWGRNVLAAHLHPGAAIKALPDAMRAIQTTFARKPRSANLLRALIMAFLRDAVGRGNPLYVEVVSLRRLKEPRSTRSKMTLRDVQEAANALEPKLAAIVWSLALTGMRPKEYWTTPWRVVLPDRVRIEGSKSAGSFRDVPLIGNVVAPSVARVTFRKKFKEKLPQWKVYDLRHAYAGILEEAGIPRARRLLYMGRGPKDVQDLYEFREISEYLSADTARIAAYLNQLGGIRPTLKVVGKK